MCSRELVVEGGGCMEADGCGTQGGPCGPLSSCGSGHCGSPERGEVHPLTTPAWDPGHPGLAPGGPLLKGLTPTLGS
ncbi:unnamed protein product [Arctogadus glacialis]